MGYYQPVVVLIAAGLLVVLIAAGLLPACSGVGYYQPVAVDHHVHAMNTVDHVYAMIRKYYSKIL